MYTASKHIANHKCELEHNFYASRTCTHPQLPVMTVIISDAMLSACSVTGLYCGFACVRPALTGESHPLTPLQHCPADPMGLSSRLECEHAL